MSAGAAKGMGMQSPASIARSLGPIAEAADVSNRIETDAVVRFVTTMTDPHDRDNQPQQQRTTRQVFDSQLTRS
jgi:hypothetical protein